MARTTTILFLSLTLAACAKKTDASTVDMAGDAMRDAATQTNTGLPTTLNGAVSAMVANFQRVHFGVDQDSLDDASKEALADNAAIMKQHGKIVVEVQGHADERGTTEYNLALGERRAAAVRKALVAMGVDGARIRLVTFGEERPLVPGHDEQAWTENRRAEFRVLVSDVGVGGTTQ